MVDATLEMSRARVKVCVDMAGPVGKEAQGGDRMQERMIKSYYSGTTFPEPQVRSVTRQTGQIVGDGSRRNKGKQGGRSRKHSHIAHMDESGGARRIGELPGR